MPTTDDFDPDNPLPSFLSHADEHEQWGTPEYKLPGTSPILKASLLAIAVMVGGIALAVWLGKPVKVFADAAASLTDSSAAQRSADPTAPPIQSAADAPVSAPIPVGAPAQEAFAAVAEPAPQARTENSEPPSGALLSQFQAWAAKQDAQAPWPAQPLDTAPAQPLDTAPAQPAETTPAQVAENDPAPERPMHKHRKARSVQNARAEIRHVQKPRARLAREQNAPGLAPPVQDARAQGQPVQTMQNAQPPSFLQSLGLHQ